MYVAFRLLLAQRSLPSPPTMDFFNNPVDFMPIATIALLLLLMVNRVLEETIEGEYEEDNIDVHMMLEHSITQSSLEMEAFTRAALHSFRLCNVFSLLDDELRYWVKPRSTTWFSRFLLEQYDDKHWIKIFRMTKAAMMSLAEVLKPSISKKDTKYRLAIPVLVRVACALFKLTHGASLLICSEMFAVGHSTVSLVLREVVEAVNVVLRSEITWPTGQRLVEVEADFRHLCGLPGVVGAIDGTHVGISKPRVGSIDYFYFKSGGYSLNCQAVVDSNKRFLDLYLGMPGSTNDSRVLRRSTLYHRGMQNTLWNSRVSFDGFSPYLLGDSGYPLLPWLMVPSRSQNNLSVAENLFNRKLRRGRGVVENAFGILKLSFRELLLKSDLDVTFLPDVITACAILHNMLLGQSHADVETLFHILEMEGLHVNSTEEGNVAADVNNSARDDVSFPSTVQKRRELAGYLALQRGFTV